MVRTLTGPYMITTSPSVTICNRCKCTILAVTVDGLDRHIGTEALNSTGELAATLDGRQTYEIHGDVIVFRSARRLRKAHPVRVPVVADHACGTVPGHYLDPGRSETVLALVVRTLGGHMVDPRIDPPF